MGQITIKNIFCYESRIKMIPHSLINDLSLIPVSKLRVIILDQIAIHQNKQFSPFAIKIKLLVT